MSQDNTDKKPDSVRNEFNAKTVRFSELKQLRKALEKAELTFLQKVQVTLLSPYDMVRGLKIARKYLTDTAFQQQIKDQSPDGTIGMYSDQQKNSYVNAANFNALVQEGYKNYASKTLADKRVAINMKAFEQARDYQNDPSVKLRPF